MANPKVILTGRIGQNPEPFANNKGLRLRVATNDRVKNDTTGEWENGKASWFTVKLWGRQADLGSVLRKGQEITVVGTITEETWVDKQTNANRSTYEITADSVAVTTLSLGDKPARVNNDDIWGADLPSRTEVAPF